MNRFTVIGKLGFPLDMLRYDSCYPADQESVAQIYDSIVDRDYKKPYRVTLLGSGPTVARWKSFLWKVE